MSTPPSPSPPYPVLTADEREAVRDVINEEMDKHLGKLAKLTGIVVFVWSVMIVLGGYAIKANVESAALSLYLDTLKTTTAQVQAAEKSAAQSATDAAKSLGSAKRSVAEASKTATTLRGAKGEIAKILGKDESFQKQVTDNLDLRLGRLQLGSQSEGEPLILKGNVIVDGTFAVRYTRIEDGAVKEQWNAVELGYNDHGGVASISDMAGHVKVQLRNATDDNGGILRLFDGSPGEDPQGRFRQGTGKSGFQP